MGKPDVRCSLFWEERKVRTPQGRILPNGKPQQCGAAPQKQTARHAPFWLALRDRKLFLPGKGEMVV